MPFFKAVQLPFLKYKAGDLTGKDVADIGSQDGFMARYFKSQTQGKVYGVDSDFLV